MSEEINMPMIVRKYPNGDLIALFPTQPSDYEGHYCSSYMYEGQHGGADYNLVVSQTVRANDIEAREVLLYYTNLTDSFNHPQDAQYNYYLRKVRTPKMIEAFNAETERFYNLK